MYLQWCITDLWCLERDFLRQTTRQEKLFLKFWLYGKNLVNPLNEVK